MKLLAFDPAETLKSLRSPKRIIRIDGTKIRRAFQCDECSKVMWHYVNFTEHPIIKECKGCDQETTQTVYYSD